MASKVRGRDPLAALFRLQAAEPNISDYTAAKLIPIELLEDNPQQPRMNMAPEALQDLSDSIASRGILQPIVVCRRGDRFQIIAGHRRRAAARMAGLDEVPCVVLDVSDDDLLELALIENLLREELDPLDEARAFVSLRERYGYSLRDIARRINKHHEYVAMRMRLLTHPEISEAVQQGMKPTVAERISRIEDADLRNGILDRAAKGERIRIKDVPNVPRRGRRNEESDAEDDDDFGAEVLDFAQRRGRPVIEERRPVSQPASSAPSGNISTYTLLLQELATRLEVLTPAELPVAEAREAAAYLSAIREQADRHLRRLQSGGRG